MDNKHQQYYQQITELVLTHLTPVLIEKLENQQRLIEEAGEKMAAYHAHMDQEGNKVEVLEVVRKMKTLKESLAESVQGISSNSSTPDLDEDFSEYFAALSQYAETLPETLLEDQSIDRFQPFQGDSFRIKVGKRVKKWAMVTGWTPTRLANWFREKRGKPLTKLKIWQHQVPLRGMIIYHFRDLMVEQLIDMMQAINRAIAVSTHELFTIETGLDQKFADMVGLDAGESEAIEQTDSHNASVDEILMRIRELADAIGGMTSNRLDRIFEMFSTNYQLVGTIELPVSVFESKGLESAHKQAVKAYTRSITGWQNTLTVLADRYNFDHELFKTRFSSLEQYFFISQKLDILIREKILGEIRKISKFLESKRKMITVGTETGEDFKKLLREVRFDTSRYMKSAIPECIHFIIEQGIPEMLDNMVAKTIAQVDQLSESRYMVKNISYDHAIKESDINKIAPKELITFEALPQYLESIESLDNEVDEVIENTQLQLLEISNISDFNLETALEALDEADQHDKAKTMSIEGLERAHGRVDDIATDLEELTEKADKVIRQAVGDFNKHLLELNEIDQAFDTQVRIAKAKAVEKTKALREHYVSQFRKFLPRLITNLKRRGLMLYKSYRDYTQRYGITSSVQELSAEVSGFLADTEKTVKNLPYVYQRLFEISPLDNPYFYEPRPRENLTLKKAYENWNDGHYGATALIAEGGSGLTTLIYFFLRELDSNVPVIQLGTKNQIYSRKGLFEFFAEELKTDGFHDTDSLVDYLNQLDGKRILILEDLEHFFLRRVNGFECIRAFIEIINRTNQNIFWLTTVNEFSYQYLVKTLHIDEFFSYNIQLRPLKPEQITSMVLKRHRVSGFNLEYKPHKIDRKNKRFQNMNDDEQQEYLQKEYFNNLNRIAQSNIAVALVYWLRSITEIEDDVMHIRSIKGVDFSFLKTLSAAKLFTLLTMLLHDGITISNHAKIFQHTLKESKLSVLPLYDDGIIVHKDGRFYINPLLFRQVVTLLRDKNILH